MAGDDETARDDERTELRALREAVKRLETRVEALEAAARPSEPGPSDEVRAVITAAIAAYLGVRPRLGRIRLAPSPSWVQAGRVDIQASHARVKAGGGRP